MAVKIACVQTNVVFGDPQANAGVAVAELERLAKQGVRLAVFPEAFLTGYCVDSEQAAEAIAIERSDPSIASIANACERLEMIAVVGFAERDASNRYNSAAILEVGVEPRFYRKAHLPELGLDKFVGRGNELEVFDTAIGKLGVLVCFDMRFPEATRVLALEGAELIALPTNWPEGAEVSAEHICIARAAENRVFFATCNRVGTENGFSFIGRSKIIAPSGVVVASAGDGAETILAEVDLSLARNKRAVTIPGRYETDAIGERRPELYGRIVQSKS